MVWLLAVICNQADGVTFELCGDLNIFKGKICFVHFSINKLLEPGLQVYACNLSEGWEPLHKMYVNWVLKRVLMLTIT